MKSQNDSVSLLRFVCHPECNPFLSLLWERARQNPELFLRKQFASLGILLVISLLTLLVFELLEVNPLLRGGWLLDAVVLAHIIAALVYSPNKLVPLQQFWREVNRHDLLLTGVPALWLVIAYGFCEFVFQAHFALLCLPFYAAAFAMGAPIDAILLVLISSLHLTVFQIIAFMGWLYWFLFCGLTLRISPLWENVPFLLQQPISIYAWQLPAWTVVLPLLALAIVWLVMNEAWSLEQRLIPSQISVRRWRRFSGWAFGTLLWGLGWAYLPISYIAKVAITLCLLRLAISMAMLEMIVLTEGHPQKAWKPTAAFWGALPFDGTALVFCAFIGAAEGQGNAVLRALTIGSTLSLIHAISFALSLRFWLRLPKRNLPTNVTSTIFFVWFLSPASLPIAFLAPQFSWLGALAGIQGWLVPLSMVGTLKLPFPLPTHFQFVFPSWWQMASVQLAWSFLLFVVERKFAPVPQKAKPYLLTPEHPIFGWLVRLEDKMMERLDNALVNVQIRWQRHHSVGYLYASAVLALLGLVAIVIVALLPPLRVWLPKVLLVLPSGLCIFAWFMAERALTVVDVKHALWRWGHLRLMEQIILTRLTAKQIRFGLWFPRFWLMLKIIALPLTVAWIIALSQLFVIQPAPLKLLMLVGMLLGTFSLLLGSITAAVMSVVGSAIGKEATGSLIWFFWFMPSVYFVVGLVRFSLLTFLAFIFAAFLIVLLVLLFALLWGLWHLRRINELKTPKGYEIWLQRADKIARKQLKVQ